MNQEQLFPSPELEAPTAPVPRVSVLIRTTGRATLARAIDSIRRQHFSDWEIVVVNAGGQPIAELGSLLSGTRHRVVEPGSRVDRALAANMLLDAAQGPLLQFLDDDDWLMPDHLGKLAAALDTEPSLAAAYSDVVVLAHAGLPNEKAVHTFAQDWDRGALQLQNYLPIHAVLFRAGALAGEPPLRFDAGLTLFEDWDFWLQLAARGPFRRVPGVSAIYAYEPAEGSGHAAQGAQREAMLLALAQRQLRRWQPSDVTALIERDARRSNETNESAQQLAASREEAKALGESLESTHAWAKSLEALAEQHGAMLRELEALAAAQRAELASQQAELARQQAELGRLDGELRRLNAELGQLAHLRDQLLAQIAELKNSRSWRITAPLRDAGRVARDVRARLRVIRPLAITARNELARHGPLGFMRRLPYYLRHRETYVQRIAAVAPGLSNPFDSRPPPLRIQRLHPDLDLEIETIDTSVSVVIPTYNAGPEFAWLMRKLREQKAVREIEIVIVDSGSRDSTVALAREAGAKVIEIPNSEFTHSHARNLGARNASGEYLLFMVQDAYPVGEHWMYGMLRAMRDPAHPKLVAVSCSEFGRADSDLMYDSMIDTHYRFLGCLEQDRIGSFVGDDHMSLRTRGQLSDISCLIQREVFKQFPYEGDYAEDLNLGIRLIKAGHEVAMLASVKTIHSHNRPAYYYLKRSFVDVEFLVGMFDDFLYPYCESLAGLVSGIVAAAAHTTSWLAEIDAMPAKEMTGAKFKELTARWRSEVNGAPPAGEIDLGDERVAAFVRSLPGRFDMASADDAKARDEARRFADSYLARLDHFARYAAQVYDDADCAPQAELSAAISKTFASTVGSALAFYYLDHAREGVEGHEQAHAVHRELTAGV